MNRPAFETEKSYSDVLEDDRGYLEISFGKRRGILPDAETFRPDELVTLDDALLWVYRTRNVRELPDMQQVDLPSMMSDFPLLNDNSRPLDGRVTRTDLLSFIAKLDGQLRKEVHEVSFYADDFHGNGTAFGDVFDMHALTAAHRSFPSNTLVKVTNVDNKKYVVVRINDRGPYVDGRDMDLSKAAFEAIAPIGQGVLRATFERLGHMDLVDKCKQRQRLYQRRITRDTLFFRGVPHTFTLGDQLILQSNRPFVVLGITFPDGQYLRIQDFVHPKEKYRITPDISGRYSFRVGDTLGHYREMRMDVSGCLQSF
ncbi:MAG: septal ring lytic transglycosylase RlpA family protein [bacterium]|nr:septal ring lytic transglycosylase RlpA family protein [bacterium]MDA1292427.1 septal ring lytic transglycosylase RlpA family protein [bacterium]